MNDDSRDDDLRDIERQIRSWATRPPARSPGAARTRVVARLGERRSGHRWRLALGFAGVAAVALALTTLFLPPSPPELGPADPFAVAAAEPPAAGLLIYELSSGTKLYLDLASRSANGPAETAFRR